MRIFSALVLSVGLVAALLLAGAGFSGKANTAAHRPMLAPVSGVPGRSVSARPLFTVGDAVGSYTPPGLLDGIGALRVDDHTVRVFVAHEIRDREGSAYRLANGVRLTGARITAFDLDRADRSVRSARLAYDAVVGRDGAGVTHARQINENSMHPDTDGLDRFCSAVLVRAGTFGMRDNVFFVGEENTNGTLYALDVAARVLYAVPAAGRALFENVAPIQAGDEAHVAFLISDDNDDTPLYLYVGRRGAADDGFLARNGLADGDLYVWVSDAGDRSADEFHGTGATRTGRFVKIPAFDRVRAGTPGYDSAGRATMVGQHELAREAGAFALARPEDVATSPTDPRSAVLAVTGNGKRHPNDEWGDILRVDVAFDGNTIAATLTILYDGDDAGGGQFADPDAGLRSPDNLCWAGDGFVYVQEDRATRAFGATSGEETSIWRLDPASGTVARILRIDRTAVPAGQVDTLATETGVWESSGIIDVTGGFDAAAGERLFLSTVQAHSLVGPALGGSDQRRALVRGGQLLMLSVRPH